MNKRRYNKETCVICKKEFMQNSPAQICCSQHCSKKRVRDKENQRRRKSEIEMTRQCLNCSLAFIAKNGRQIFCSKPCFRVAANKTQRQNHKKKITIKQCLLCDKDYIIHGNQKYCSEDCADIARDKYNEKYHKDYKEKERNYNRSIQGRYVNSIKASSIRGYSFELSIKQYELEISKPCYYCKNELGAPVITGVGLDRLDNAIGYIIDNVVSCCKICNTIKGACLTAEETKAAVEAILEYRKSIIRDVA